MTHFSLKRTLAEYLNQAISPKNHAVDGNFTDFSHEYPPQPDFLSRIGKNLSACHQDIPLKKINYPENIVYVSAVARKLASEMQLSADKIAESLLSIIRFTQAKMSTKTYTPDGFSPAQLISTVKVTQQPSGWLQFSLSAPGLSLWLQHINQQGRRDELFSQTRLTLSSSLQADTLGWQVQLAYSRCCTLLKLAERHQTLQFCRPPAAADRYQLAGADLFSPRLNTGLALASSGTRQLIHSLIDATDRWAANQEDRSDLRSGDRLLKLAATVAKAFEQFDQATPLWSLSLAQRRLCLGLVRSVQVILQRLAFGPLGPLTEQL